VKAIGSIAVAAIWLAEHGETIRLAQEFEAALLGLLLTVRDYRNAESAAEDFPKLLAGDLKCSAGTVLERIFEDRKLIKRLILETFGRVHEIKQVPNDFGAAIEARNILAHYYFRVHRFNPELAHLLVDDLQALRFVLVIGLKVAQSLQAQLSPEKIHWGNLEIMRREIEHLERKHTRAHELADQGRKMQEAWSRLDQEETQSDGRERQRPRRLGS
jgi:hypothetical protein